MSPIRVEGRDDDGGRRLLPLVLRRQNAIAVDDDVGSHSREHDRCLDVLRAQCVRDRAAATVRSREEADRSRAAPG